MVTEARMEATVEKLKRNRVFLCLECGKCTAVCPISAYNNLFSPRRMLAEGLFYDAKDLVNDCLLWTCLTCQLCSQRCPVDVKYSDYIRDIRAEAYRLGKWGNPSHGGALQYIMEMSASPQLLPSRSGWVDTSLKISTKGDVVYFVGCLPFFQDFFAKDFAFTPISIASDTVRILNRLGIEPVVMDNERCCGHDLYWLGQLEKFDELGKINLKELKATGAKTVITSCPECAIVLKQYYPQRLGNHGLEVKHITELVAENIKKLSFKGLDLEISYQDPCRLGRYMGIYDQPRQSLEAIPGVHFYEMAHSRRGAICCGTTNWMNCDAVSKQIQKSRLEEAKSAGAKVLVTACPKCQIHFRCAECGQEGQRTDIEIMDFVNIVASALAG